MRTDQKLFCLKVVLTIFLCFLWLVGAAIFGIVLWFRLDFWTNEYIQIDIGLDRYLILIYISLAAGAVIVAFSISGLIGGCLKKKLPLVVYLIGLVAAMGLTVGAVTYGVIYRDELERSLVRGDTLQKLIKTSYVQDYSKMVTRVIDIMQSELECCGGNSPLDYLESSWLMQVSVNSPGTKVVPATCCKNYYRYQSSPTNCQMYVAQSDRELSTDIWKDGCQIKLQAFLDRYIVVVIGIAAFFFVLQVICTSITSYLIHLLNSLYVPQPDDIVYDMAHNQEKSPYPSRGDYREYYA
ncbi:CD151 antigen-like [Physella acuta]|uniref:CD151 antigen-like n=1 Tax=Physella acuta TaxID=109671 RepID=UPI0027DB9B6E|nr:CD151 antigen-like [Physella acuta]